MNICVVDLDDPAFAGVDKRKGRDLETLLAHAPDAMLDKAGDLYDWLAYAVANRIELGDPALDWALSDRGEFTRFLDGCKACYEALNAADIREGNANPWEDLPLKWRRDFAGMIGDIVSPYADGEKATLDLFDAYVGIA